MSTDTFVRPEPSAQAQRWDWALAIGMYVCAVISAGLSSAAMLFGTSSAGLGWALALSLTTTLPLAFRRRFPIPVAVIVCLSYFLIVTFHVPEIYVSNVAMFIAVYTIGAWMTNRRAAFLARVGLMVFMFFWLLVTTFFEVTNPSPEVTKALGDGAIFNPYVAYMLLQLLINVAFFGGAYYMGDRAYSAARERAALDQRQRELEQEREVTAAQAVALDRVAIARELHDVVAHHVSAMGVQAGAARAVIDMNPESAATAMRAVEDSARAAIDELHHLLETLRTPGGAVMSDAPSTLRLEHIADLVKRSGEVGLPATLTVVGAERPVPELIQANLYRIAQEALTNARRHGGPHASADVRLRYLDDGIELEIANTGRSAIGSRSGLGQLGMRERAAASGGTIEIGPRARGGFLVRAHVPVSADATTEPQEVPA